nr:hypothetical protein [Tanacetum cinerariifolium]
MVAILEKSEHNVDFHPMMDFIEASPLRIVPLFNTMLVQQSEGSGTPTEPHHIPSPEAQPPSHTTHSSSSLPPVTTTIPTVTPSETTPIRQYTRTARIAQSFALPTVADEPESPLRDISQGEACPTDSGFIADQDRATIAKSSTLPHDSAPRVTSFAVAKGTTVLASGAVEVPTGSGSIPTASPPTAEVSTGSDMVPTASPVFATATVVTPYRRRKGKEVMVESETPKKQKVQEQIDAQVARELEEQLEREDQRRSAQIARDTKIARIHVEEELQIMIDGLDRKLISDLVKYQDNYAKIYKFQSQQSKLWTKKQKKDYYMAMIRSNLGWKVKDFRGMTFEEVKAKFNSVWNLLEDFIPMGSKEEVERIKRKGLSLEQESAKKQKTSKEVTEEAKSFDELPEEKVYTERQRSYWKITRLGGSSASYQFFIYLLKYLYREDLNQLWRLVKETLSNRPPTSDKEMELWVELSRLYEPDHEDQLWTHTQNLMHAPVEWKLYNSYGVHHVTSKDKEIFMLLEKDYPLKKGLALVMISYKLQVENYSQMANDLILKIYKIANSPRQQRD